jgi:peptidoglycan/LPS O-acetylase OafA/YrhL
VSQRDLGEVVKAFLLFPQDRSILSSSFLGVSWTLSFEVFFYIMFGLLIGLKPKLSMPIVATWLGGTFVHFIGLIQLPKDSLLLQFIFDEHNLEFALGCLAAYLLYKYKFKYGMALISIGAFMYTLSAINYYYELIEVSAIISFGVPSMLLVIGAGFLEMNRSVKIPYLLIYIGNASYSIYLIHGFIINNITKLMIKLNPDITQNLLLLNTLGMCIAIIAVFFGIAMYSYLEKPLISIFKPRLAKT